MRTLDPKYLSGLEIKEDIYKVDLAVLDRYQSFSSELLRLSLLGVAGYGFLLSSVVFRIDDTSTQFIYLEKFLENQELLMVGAITFGLSAMMALAHRFFSTDCLTHFVRRIRLIKQNGETTQGADPVADAREKGRRDATIETEKESLVKDLRRCKWLLILACGFLALGTICFAIAVAATLLPT